MKIVKIIIIGLVLLENVSVSFAHVDETIITEETKVNAVEIQVNYPIVTEEGQSSSMEIQIDDVTALASLMYGGYPLFDRKRLMSGTMAATVVEDLQNDGTMYLHKDNKAAFSNAGVIKQYVSSAFLNFEYVRKVNDLLSSLVDPRLRVLREYIIDCIYKSAEKGGTRWKNRDLIPPQTENDFNNSFLN